MKNILILGKSGQVGWELQRTLAPLGQIIAIDQDTVDLSKPDAIMQTIRRLRPDIIVNAAAYTAVDKAESEQALAMAINGTAPGVMAEEAKRIGAVLIHYSTDYVFNGKAAKPYKEEDQPQPLNIYGHTKLAGEQAIRSVGGSYIILRTSWVYGMRGKNFLLTMLKLAHEKSQLKVVADQVGAPTWSRMLAQATAHILASCHEGDKWGLYHLSADGQTSWKEFAQMIFKIASQNPEFKAPEVIAIPSSDYPTPAQRPLYSMLCNAKVQEAFSMKMPSWDDALELCMQDLRG